MGQISSKFRWMFCAHDEEMWNCLNPPRIWFGKGSGMGTRVFLHPFEGNEDWRTCILMAKDAPRGRTLPNNNECSYALREDNSYVILRRHHHRVNCPEDRIGSDAAVFLSIFHGRQPPEGNSCIAKAEHLICYRGFTECTCGLSNGEMTCSESVVIRPCGCWDGLWVTFYTVATDDSITLFSWISGL